ncbi:MAG: hypothetical protein LBP70_03545 [Mycoplasmataceae bacterium]|nr:hypothetical protein [Mycoplasmataceae bacterium]
MLHNYQKSHLTKPIVISLFCLTVLITFLLIWLLLGDINILNQQWLIPYKGVMWSGKITENNYQSIFEIYQHDIQYWGLHPIGDAPQWDIKDAHDFLLYSEDDYFQSGMTILSSNLKLTWQISLIIGVVLLAFISLPLFFKIFGWMNIDVLTFVITIALGCIAFIYSGLIPHTFGTSWIWIIRVVIMLAAAAITFLLVNKFINFLMLKSGIGDQSINELVNRERERIESSNTLKDLKEQYKKGDDLTYVDLNKDD